MAAVQKGRQEIHRVPITYRSGSSGAVLIFSAPLTLDLVSRRQTLTQRLLKRTW